MKFIADAMNGDLAKWLRILGYDCVYETGKENSDEDIVKLAFRDRRIVLTADEELFRRCLKKGVIAVYTPMEDVENKLKRLVKKFNLKTDFSLRPRCTICNTELTQVRPDELRGKISEKMLKRYDSFWVCRRCGKIYWEGSHWIDIKKRIRRIKKQVTS